MIWGGAKEPSDLPAPRPETNSSAVFSAIASSRKVELALFKSISTGIFIDLQFHAYNVVSNNLPLDPKPLFASSIVIEDWRRTIATRKFEGFRQFALL